MGESEGVGCFDQARLVGGDVVEGVGEDVESGLGATGLEVVVEDMGEGGGGEGVDETGDAGKERGRKGASGFDFGKEKRESEWITHSPRSERMRRNSSLVRPSLGGIARRIPSS